MIKYYCDYCSVEIPPPQRNDLTIHTTEGHDTTLHLCDECLEIPLTSLIPTLRVKNDVRFGERERIMEIRINGSVMKLMENKFSEEWAKYVQRKEESN